jgi:hypothetical protein
MLRMRQGFLRVATAVHPHHRSLRRSVLVRACRWGNALVREAECRADDSPRCGSASITGDPPVLFSTSLRPMSRNHRLRLLESSALGGMRNTIQSVEKSPVQAKLTGMAVLRFFQGYVDRCSGFEQDILVALSAKDAPAFGKDGYLEERVDSARQSFAKFLGARSGEPVCNGVCQTGIRAELLDRWAELAQDKGRPVVKWLWEGAPAGVLELPVEVDDIFPKTEETDENPPSSSDSLDTDFDGFSNYSAFDGDRVAEQEVLSYVKKGYLKALKTLKDAEAYLGGKPVLSRFNVLSKTKMGKVKRCAGR